MNTYLTTRWRRMAAMLALAILLGLPQVSKARTLELGDNGRLRITSTLTAEIESEEPMSLTTDSIRIDKIILTYNGHSKDSLVILNDTDTIFRAKFQSELLLSDINRGEGIVLSAQKKYTLSHGGKIWTLSFKNNTQSSVQEEVVVEKTTETEEDKKKSKGLGFWILWIIVAFVMGIAGGFCFKKKLRKLYKKLFIKGEKTIETPPIDNKPGATQPDQEKDKEIETLKQQLQQIEQVVNEMCQGSGTDSSVEGKLQRIQITVSEGKEAIKKLKGIMALLPGAKGEEDIIPEVEKLKGAATDGGKDEKEKLKEDFAQKCVEKVNTSSNKDLKDLMKKAEDEVGANGKPTMAIEKFIELLRSQYKEDTPGKGTQSLEITNIQLSDSTNRRKIMHWCIDKLSEKGYKDLNNSKNNNVDYIFSRLADLLNQAKKESPRLSNEEIVTQAIKEKKLTDAQKNILLKGLIEVMNQQLDVSHKLTDTTLDEFVKRVVVKIQMPDTQEGARKQERKLMLSMVNDVLGCDMTQLDADGLQRAQADALLKSLRDKIKGLEADNLDGALKELSAKAKQSKELEELLEQFGVKSADKLEDAIRKEQFEKMSKSITGKLESLLPDEHFDSTQKLVNALIKLAEDSKKEVSLVTNDLDERLSSLDSTHQAGKKPTELLDRYTTLLTDKEEKLTEKINEKEEEVNKLNDAKTESENRITELEEKNGNLMSATQSMLDELHAYANELGSERPQILLPCSANEEKQCEDIEDRLYESLDNVATRLKAFDVPDGTTPAEAKKAIQRELVDIVKEENNPIDKICRYYAYSRLPFMTDDSRNYGVKFNRNNMSALYAAVNNLFVAFGISFDIPALFVMGVKESGCEDLTGTKYGDLDNLCPNSCNHVGNIDTQNKPANVVVDIVNVGYTVEGKKETTTSVITY